MNRKARFVSNLGLVLALATAGQAAARQDRGWSASLAGVSTRTTGGEDTASSLGLGLDIKYRISPRLGVALDVSSGELENELEFDFFDTEFTLESSLRATPVLARLDWHLTPTRRADLYVGPVFGLVRYGDMEVELRGDGLEEEMELMDAKVDDGFAWGAHIGVDVPIGRRGAFFTAGATYLRAEVETEGLEDPEVEGGGDFSFDLDPFMTRIGFGYRF